MTLTSTSTQELEERTRAVFQRTLALLRTSDPGRPLTSGTWTCQDVAAHLLTVQRRYTQRDFTLAEGLATTPTGLTEANGADVDALGSLTMTQLIDQLEAEFPDYLAVDLDPRGRYPFHCDMTVDGAGARGNFLGELLIHSWDVARTMRQPWPVQERDAVLHLNGILQFAGAWIDPAKTRTWDFAVDLVIPEATTQRFRVEHGACTITDANDDGTKVDATIRGRAQVLDLLLFKRITLARAVSRGVLVIGGRRPWIGVRLPGAFLAA